MQGIGFWLRTLLAAPSLSAVMNTYLFSFQNFEDFSILERKATFCSKMDKILLGLSM